MPLDPQVKALLDQLASLGAPPIADLTPTQARQQFEAALAPMSGNGPELPSVEDRNIPGPDSPVLVRVYRPSEGNGDALPVLVWFHGGGWVLGNVPGSDVTCRHLAKESGRVVVSVEYRLAPEYPFPAGAEDCYAATAWVATHASEIGVDPSQLAVGGDSAGGNLAAVITLMAKERGGPDINKQLLVYPVTDGLMSYPSMRENAEGYLLTEAAMKWFWGHYLGNGGNEKEPLASPIYADDLSGLPPALVMTAEFDPLRDEGEAYAKRLEQAGVPVTTTRYDGQIHGFFGMSGVFDTTAAAIKEAAAFLSAPR
jgi:acetyl esterase